MSLLISFFTFDLFQIRILFHPIWTDSFDCFSGDSQSFAGVVARTIRTGNSKFTTEMFKVIKGLAQILGVLNMKCLSFMMQ